MSLRLFYRQHQDTKNGGTNLIKKKMKKSGSKTSLHSTSNYMRSTTSADARRERSKVSRKSLQTSPHNSSSQKTYCSTNSPNPCLNSSKDATERLEMMRTLKKRIPSTDVLCENSQVELATCSSTLKGRKFPDYLKLSHGGTESDGVKVCPYSRCSLNGHNHALLAPLKSFVSERRRALKTERSQLPKVRPTFCADLKTTSNGEAEMYHDIDPRENLEQIGHLNSAHAHEDFLIKSDDRFGRLFDEISVESLNDSLFQGNETLRIGPQSGCNAMDGEEHILKDESLPNEDATTEMENKVSYLSKSPVEEMTTWVDSATCNAIKHDQDHVENEYSDKDLTNEPYPAECNAVDQVNPRNMAMPETEEKSSTRAAVKCDKSNQDSDEPEAERVNLRHQEVDARKNAEEWMVDYALREAVTRISPARQRKVALLVQAFERVLPTSKS